MFETETVTLRVPRTATDAHGNPSPDGYDDVDVPGVLAQPGPSSDLDATRPEGVRVDMTFHWPRTDHRSLRGCRVMRGGREFSVIGDPQPPTEGNVPGPWDRTVETEACDG